MKRKLAIIGAGEFQNPLILKAKKLGMETHVFAWKCGDIGEKNADFFYPISIKDKERILEVCKKIRPCGVISIASDLATITVNYVSRNLGLTCNPLESDSYSTNKYLMRNAMKQKGVRTPRFMLVDENTPEELLDGIHYPVIVKPTDRSGSRAINQVSNLDELHVAVKCAVDESFENKAICEGIIEGQEYSCECISYNGEHHILAYTKKFTTGNPHYIETGHLEPGLMLEETNKEIEEEIFRGLDALHIKFGASHCEFKIGNDGKIRIIEIGSRMGGDCIGSDLVPLSTGYDYTKMVIEIACGEPLNLSEIRQNSTAFIYFIFNKLDIVIAEEFIKNESVTCVQKVIKPYTEEEVTDSSKRFGYYILTCNEREIAEKFLSLRK